MDCTTIYIDDQHAIAHNKILIIDRPTLITGSFNFTKAAEEKNAENLLVLKGNRALLEQYLRHFEEQQGSLGEIYKKTKGEVIMGWHADLRDERWQEKRRSILERDQFMCVKCGVENVTLDVHHNYYEPFGSRPWDYDDDTLFSLCRECHTEVQKMLLAVHICIARVHPKGLEAFLDKIPDMAYDIAYDIAYEDAYEVINPYHEYDVAIAIDKEFNDLSVRDAAKDAELAFRGIMIDFTSTDTSGNPHGTANVVGPDPAIEMKIKEWIESRTGHVSF